MAGYSSKTLSEKLGIKSNSKVLIINMPDDYIFELMPFPENIRLLQKMEKEIDIIQLFIIQKKELTEKLNKLKTHIKKNGCIWISWPKKSSNKSTDLDENIIREAGLKNGLVDVKVCAVNDIWSGLKFVYRLRDR